MVYAITVCVTGSVILLTRMFGRGPRMKYCAGCGLAICSGSDRIEASQRRRLLAHRGVDRQAGVVAQLGSGTAVRLVFVNTGRPFAGNIDLAKRELTKQWSRQYERGHGPGNTTSPH